MAKASKEKTLNVRFSTEVARQIRQHARSQAKTEVCGVLIGKQDEGFTEIQACIAGANAAQGGAHVTFTQDTWEHIYKVKDRDFPDDRIVGWYHSHPGFGVFLSDHDTFIHKNFFSAPEQIAWVYDPHSDEEGCFGWHSGRLERVGRFSFIDGRGGEPANVSNKAEPGSSASSADGSNPYDWSDTPLPKSNHAGDDFDDAASSDSDEVSRLTGIVSALFSHLAIFLIGGLVVWFLLPHYVGVMIPVDPRGIDPRTGFPYPEYLEHIQQAFPKMRIVMPDGSSPSSSPQPSAPAQQPPASTPAPAQQPPPASSAPNQQTRPQSAAPSPNSNPSSTKGNNAHQ